MNDNEPVTGGCQCGAVRYALTAPLHNPHICHCRMCQKAFGSFFAPLVNVERPGFQLTRGQLSKFRSSDTTDRGFCSRCGTPLTCEYIDADRISVAIGSLDHPEHVVPGRQEGIESRLPYFADLAGLESSATEDDDPELAARIRETNHQHPDHDTEVWPVAGREDD